MRFKSLVLAALVSGALVTPHDADAAPRAAKPAAARVDKKVAARRQNTRVARKDRVWRKQVAANGRETYNASRRFARDGDARHVISHLQGREGRSGLSAAFTKPELFLPLEKLRKPTSSGQPAFLVLDRKGFAVAVRNKDGGYERKGWSPSVITEYGAYGPETAFRGAVKQTRHVNFLYQVQQLPYLEY